MAGRGSFIESFPLFGYDLDDYAALFSSKLELLLELRRSERVSWSGPHRPAIPGLGVYPRPLQAKLPVWVAVGGTPQSAVRAGLLGLPMALAIIGGLPERFTPFVELHRRAAREAGHDPARVPLGINSHGYVADTASAAVDESFPSFATMMNAIGRERGWPAIRRGDYERSARLRGANFVGSPPELVQKILYQHELFAHDRFLLQLTVGSLPHDRTMRAIELFGTEVAPAVRAELARRGGADPGPDAAG
jgi:alkanesulfonate monooxygenase SsuD/methylene tetrahydromethanopterin reductase-like flavin-dependent oxidoreductase (luciferase family)